METDVPDENLVHCIYASAASEELDDEALQTLLANARQFNAKVNVTGMLLYERGSFFQVLEGAPQDVEALYQLIASDPRHSRITKIIMEPIEARNFDRWTMGYAGVSTRELAKLDGLNDFFTRGKCYVDLDNGRAKTLLNAFKDGGWRAKIS